MKQAIVIAAITLLVLAGGGAAAYFLIWQPAEGEVTATVATENLPKPKAEERKTKRDDKSNRAADAKFNDLMRDGNEKLLEEPAKADQKFQEALKEAQTADQKVKAWYGRAMAAKVMENGELEYQAGQTILTIAQTTRDKANAYEAIAHGRYLRQSYGEAVSNYQQAADDYIKSGDASMACTMLVEAARILRYNMQDYSGAERILAKAGEAVDKGSVEEIREKVIKWMLCLERADNCKLAGDGAGQVFWNRAAVQYNPAWKETADWVERQVEVQGTPVETSPPVGSGETLSAAMDSEDK